MGFFQKLKQNFNHSGVKLQLQTPDTIHLNDQAADLQLTIVNTSKNTIQLHSIEVVLHSKEEASDNGTPKEEEMLTLTIPYEQQIPGHLQSVVPIEFPIQPNVDPLTPSAEIAQVASSVMNALQIGDQLFGDKKKKWYHFTARVTVEGISFDPSVSNQVNVLSPTEVGGKTVTIGV